MSKLTDKQLLRNLLRMKDGLPHLFGHPLYLWQRKHIESTARITLLTAANQAGKSTACIRRRIRRATEPELWQKLWGRRPRQFWYFYPTKALVDKEFYTKWLPDYLPRNEYKDSEQYGWKEFYEKDNVAGIEFNTGVILYFLTYEQKVRNLQSSTVDDVTFDEEPPEEIFNEMIPRTTKSGFIDAGFTATLGQEYLRCAMEEIGTPNEIFPEACKQQVSLYDCLEYEDGTPSQVWTWDKIAQEKALYTSEAEIQRRIYGRFVKSESVLFQTFSRKFNVIGSAPSLGNDFYYWAGVDAGSGGALNHPAAVIILAVHKSFTHGYIVKAWRGDGIITTSQDIIRRYVEMAADLPIIQCSYDYAGSGTDVGIYGARLGLPFVKAMKDRASGISVLNTLFKSGMLKIIADKDDSEMAKLISELTVVTADAKRSRMKDDLVDALRYAAAEVPWHFKLNEFQAPIGPAEQFEQDEDSRERWRRGYQTQDAELSCVDLELMEAADLYEF